MQFYNKQRQLLEKKHKLVDNVFRIEVQCNNRFLNKMKNKNNWREDYLPKLWKNNVMREVFTKKIKSLIGDKDFVSLKVAKSKLASKYIPSKNYHCLKEFIQFLAKHKDTNINKAKEHFSKNNQDFSPRYADKILDKIRKADINPITIPTSWKIDKIENPLNILKQNIKEQLEALSWLYGKPTTVESMDSFDF